MPVLRVGDLGEQGLLKSLQKFCPAAIVGDDAAILAVTSGRSLVITTDVLVDGVHFSDQTTSPADAGWRAAAANLSDLAAMGAAPLGITVGLGLPGHLPVAWVEHLYEGMSECLQATPMQATPILGGDLVRSPVTTIAITAIGEVEPKRAIRRSAARPGDAIVATGFHGASRGGLELLLHPEQGGILTGGDRTQLMQAHQRPQPRLDVLPWLPPDIAIAGMDSSDGLADAICQICRASGVGARVMQDAIPIHPALAPWTTSTQALAWALYGGEDFELVLCLPVEYATELVMRLGAGAAIVGTITEATDVWLVETPDSRVGVPLTLEQGFQHFNQ